MSDISDATVLGAVDKIAGAAGILADFFFDFFAFAAAARRRAADVVVFFFVLDCDWRGAAAIEARRTTANMRSFLYNMISVERFECNERRKYYPANANFTPQSARWVERKDQRFSPRQIRPVGITSR
ncbi:MAG: hypothetical protein ABIZ36_06190 [Gemmatimonadaceae bacterium]